jgi:hypothetical protein
VSQCCQFIWVQPHLLQQLKASLDKAVDKTRTEPAQVRMLPISLIGIMLTLFFTTHTSARGSYRGFPSSNKLSPEGQRGIGFHRLSRAFADMNMTSGHHKPLKAPYAVRTEQVLLTVSSFFS